MAIGERPQPQSDPTWAAMGKIASVMLHEEADGIRFLWTLNHDKDPTPRGQTVTVALKGELAHENLAEVNGAEWGQELNVLVPLSIQTVLYMAAQEPDLEWIPATQRSRHKELDTHARVGNVGWRVGSALRTWRKEASAPSSPRPLAPGTGRRPGPSREHHRQPARRTRRRLAVRDAVVPSDPSERLTADTARPRCPRPRQATRLGSRVEAHQRFATERLAAALLGHHAELRAPGERAMARLKSWRLLHKLRCSPGKTGHLVKAIAVLANREADRGRKRLTMFRTRL